MDIREIQPDLARSGHTDLSSRIDWVHVNLYRFLILLVYSTCGLIPFFASLNALEFASSSFDFVRIRYIGLAVPEDKVQGFVD